VDINNKRNYNVHMKCGKSFQKQHICNIMQMKISRDKQFASYVLEKRDKRIFGGTFLVYILRLIIVSSFIINCCFISLKLENN